MSDELYFGSGLPGYISNSRLGLINPTQNGSVSRYVSGFEDNKSDFFKLGSAVHALLLESESYKISSFVAPKGTMRSIADTVCRFMKVESVEWDDALNMAVIYHNYYGGKPGVKRMATLSEAIFPYCDYIMSEDTEGEIMLDEEMKSKVIACVNSIRENIEAHSAIVKVKGFNEGVEYFNEDVITCDYKTSDGTILPLKCKIDSWSIDVKNKILYLTDLKTTGVNIELFMGNEGYQIEDFSRMKKTHIHGSFHKFHYYRQMYMYYMMLETYVREAYGFDDTWTSVIRMTVVETIGSYRSEVFTVTPDLMEAGRIEFNFLLSKMVDNKNAIPDLNIYETGNVLGFNA